MKLVNPAVVAVVIIAVSQTASAALIAYDEFDYAAGTQIAGATGGTGWTNAWAVTGNSDNYLVATPGYSYTGYTQTPTTSNRLNDTGNNRKDIYRSFTDASNATHGTKRYIAMLVDQGGDMNIYRNGSGSNTWAFGLKGGKALISNGYDDANNLQSTTTYSTSAVHLLIARLDKATGLLDLFVDPNLSLGESGNSPVISKTFSTTNIFLTQAAFTSKNNNSAGGWDSLRIATTWNEVVPEPSSLALLALPMASLSRRRRVAR